MSTFKATDHDLPPAGKPTRAGPRAELPGGAERKEAAPLTAAMPASSRMDLSAESSSLISALRERLARRNTNSTAEAKLGMNLKEDDGKEQAPPALDRLRESSLSAVASTQVQSTQILGQYAASAGPGNGSDQSRTAELMSSPGLKPHKGNQGWALLDELTALESRCAGVAGHLLVVAQNLQSGNIQGLGIAAELTALRTDIESFQELTLELARFLSVPLDAAASPSATLGDLRAVLKIAADTQDQQAFRSLHAQAIRELESVLALEPSGGQGLSAIEECQTSVRRLMAQLAAAQWPESHPECLALVERRHAYSQLLNLVREADQLSDDEWEKAEQVVSASFGRPLAVAAVRGRLRISDVAVLEISNRNGSAASAETAPLCPSCNAELEPEAIFCGECGVKLE